MKRREFVERLGLGSAALLAGGNLVEAAASGPQGGGHAHSQVSGPLAAATVSFGQWLTDPALSRFPDLSPRTANQHLLIPYDATIKAGGSVNFLIAGFHHIAVYEPGVTLAHINTSLTVPVTNPPPTPPGVLFPPLIDDPGGRVYRGLDPSLFPQDRVEVVSFRTPGRYLVICAFLPHFLDDMHGFVKVLP
jgi:hypothetical protein